MGEYAEASRLTDRKTQRTATDDRSKVLLDSGSDDGIDRDVLFFSGLASPKLSGEETCATPLMVVTVIREESELRPRLEVGRKSHKFGLDPGLNLHTTLLWLTTEERPRPLVNNDEAEAMDEPVSGLQDDLSNYGSDFSSGDEEVLNALLHQTSGQDDCPNRDPVLLLKDIEDQEGPRGARVLRRRGQNSQEKSLPLVSKTRSKTQLNGDKNLPANSTCPTCWAS